MRLKIALLIGLSFFVAGLLTLTHYGINWDTINHLPRGQAYLHYFVTGKKDYSDLPRYFDDYTKKSEWYFQNPSNLFIDTNIPRGKVPQRSVYQINDEDFNYFMQIDGDGHPPLSDIITSVFNRVLFAKLRLINDIDSYRIYSVLLASLLVSLIFYWTSKVYGKLAAIVSTLSLALYPLFWSEMHFNNEKDVPETVFWSFMLFCLWKGLTKKKYKWVLLSGIFFGLAIGTKFNILFIPFAIIPWVLIYLIKEKRLKNIKENTKLILSGLASIFIGITIFFGSWPYLWPDPINRVGQVFAFYRRLGLGSNPDKNFFGPFGTTTYPIQWIIYTTPLIILFLSIVGIFVALLRFRKEKDKISLLFLLWFLVPIARVTWNGASVYGGIRQIMEYIPAMAILAGLGAKYIFEKFKNLKIKLVFLIILFFSFSLLLFKLHEIHPNENEYFNSLIGGLNGAQKKDFPFWGFTLGAPYRKGIQWIDDNAPVGANVVFAYELFPNIPRLWIRPDINFHNGNRSGYLQKGEYAITLRYQGTDERSYYDTYLAKYLNPVFEEKVDGVPVLSVWKNDPKYLKQSIDANLALDAQVKNTKFGLTFDIGKVAKLWRLEINYNDKDCKPMVEAYDEVSKDGKVWQRIKWNLPDDWRISYLGEQPKNGHFIEPFVGQEVRFINLFLNPVNTCLSNIKDFKIYYLK